MIERQGRMRTGTGAAAVCAALLSLATAGCGDLTSGGFGEVEVVVAADSVPGAALAGGPSASTPASFSSSLPGPSPTLGGPTRRRAVDRPIVGSLTVQVGVRIRRGRDDWIDLTDGFREATLPLDGGGTSVVARRGGIPVGEYDAIRIVFGRLEANVVRGLHVDGDTIRGRVTVELPSDGRLFVDRPLGMRVTEGQTSFLLLELRAPHWLRRVDRIRHRVDAGDVRELLRVRIHRTDGSP